MYLELFQEILKQSVGADDVKALHQPERHILVSYKTFMYLLARIDDLQRPLEDQVNALVTARMAVLTAELEKQWHDRVEAQVNAAVSARMEPLTTALAREWNGRIRLARLGRLRAAPEAQG
jgi:hypothetical protein